MTFSSSKATAAEVGIRAGVGRSALSRVFTPGASASAKTAQNIQLAAKELGYRPNTHARAMVSGQREILAM